MPLDFEPAVIGKAEVRESAVVYDPETRYRVEVFDSVVCCPHCRVRDPERDCQRAYLVGRKLRRCIFGSVRECRILKFRDDPIWGPYFEVTAERAAVKIMSRERIRTVQNIENPLMEVAAMQHINSSSSNCYGDFSSAWAQSHPHIVGILDLWQNDKFLYMFMPYYSSGDLFSVVEERGAERGLPEHEARYWFRQILDVSAESGMT